MLEVQRILGGAIGKKLSLFISWILALASNILLVPCTLYLVP